MNMLPFTCGTCWKGRKNLYVERPVSITDNFGFCNQDALKISFLLKNNVNWRKFVTVQIIFIQFGFWFISFLYLFCVYMCANTSN